MSHWFLVRTPAAYVLLWQAIVARGMCAFMTGQLPSNVHSEFRTQCILLHGLLAYLTHGLFRVPIFAIPHIEQLSQPPRMHMDYPRVRRWPSPWKLRHRAAGRGTSEKMANRKICRNPTVKRFLGICVDVDAEL